MTFFHEFRLDTMPDATYRLTRRDGEKEIQRFGNAEEAIAYLRHLDLHTLARVRVFDSQGVEHKTIIL
jgi:hypothetical protein